MSLVLLALVVGVALGSLPVVLGAGERRGESAAHVLALPLYDDDARAITVSRDAVLAHVRARAGAR